jgi:carboxylesterase type B
MHSGTYFADAGDTIVVTANDWLTISGFPGAPGQVDNHGLRDQCIDVEWIWDNIRSFGGDSAKITVQNASPPAVLVWC